MASSRARVEVAIAAAAVVVWTIWGIPVVAGLILCHAATWAAFNIAAVRGWTWPAAAWRLLPVRIAAGLAVFAAIARASWVAAPELARTEGLAALPSLLADRAANLLGGPSIAPPVLSTDRPQALFVHAPDASEVAVGFGAEPIPARALGHGLFRVDRQPPRDARTVEVRVDGTSFARPISVITPEPHPRWLCASPEAGLAAAPSEETDELAVIARAGPLRRIPTGDAPSDCAFTSSSAVAVSHLHDDAVRLVSVEDGRLIRRIPAGGPQRRLAVSPSGRRLAIAMQGGLRIVALDGEAPDEDVPLSGGADWIAYGPDDDQIVVASRREKSLRRLSGRTTWAETVPPLPLGRPAVTMARLAGGRRIAVAVTDYRPDGGAGPNHFAEDQILTIDLATWRVANALPTARSADDDDGVTGGASPLALWPAEDGGLLVAFAGTDDVARVPLGEAPVPAWSIATTGFAPRPHGVASLGGGRLAITSAAAAKIAVIQEDGTVIAAHDLAGSSVDAAIARGELAFYEATRSGLSCQSCHLHADSDGALHDIGHDAPRPTLSVRGIAGTSPYLRGASYATIGELDAFARTILGGYRHDVPDRAAALEAYVASLPPPTAPRIPIEVERAGTGAFVRARCVRCHAFPAFTNLAQYPASLLFPERGETDLLDVPSLRGLAGSAPYLHDGRAATIEDVLVRENPSGRHGDVGRLDASELAALAAFLRSL